MADVYLHVLRQKYLAKKSYRRIVFTSSGAGAGPGPGPGSGLIHIARVGVFNVDATGNILKKDDSNLAIGQQLTTSIQHLVIIDSSIPNSAGNPTVKTYLALESANDFMIREINQTTIITYLRTDTGGFAV